MNSHSHGLVFINIEFDVNLLIDIVIEWYLYLSNERGLGVVLHYEKCLYLFLKFLLIQEEISFRRILSSYFDYSLQKFFRNVLELKKPTKIEFSTWISEIVVDLSI